MRRRVLAVLAVLGVLGVLPSDAADWQEVDRLIEEFKLREAAQRLDELLPRIRDGGDEEELTRALIRGSQLRAASSEPGEAVRFLQGQEWPQGHRQRAVLSLFLAEALKKDRKSVV